MLRAMKSKLRHRRKSECHKKLNKKMHCDVIFMTIKLVLPSHYYNAFVFFVM